MIRKPLVILGATLPLMALASCSHTNQTVGHGSLSIGANAVHIRVPGAPQATIESDGTLRIARRTVPLSPAEQALARHYYQDVLHISTAGKATGEAGGKLGASVFGSLFSALWHDNSSIIKRTAKQGAARVSADVRTLCAHLANLQTTQNALAADQSAFMPYRVIRGRDVTQCLKGTRQTATMTYTY